jgi:hypothetical protein
MLTKVGHSHPMLICTDCGLPVDQRESSAMARQRLWGALTLVGLALVSGAMLLLATVYENRTAGSVEGSLDKPEDAVGEEGKKDEERFLMEPSALVKPSAMAKPKLREAGKGEGASTPTTTPAVSAQPDPAATNQEKEQPHPAEHQR